MMSTIEGFIKRHPVPTYYALRFAISWGGVLLVIGGPSGILGTEGRFETFLPTVILALLAGPSVAGVLLTVLVGGREGLRELRTRLIRWRVEVRCYAAALLVAPFLMTTIFLALSLVSSEFTLDILAADDKASHMLTGLATGLAAGIFKELGWTGFATPRLRQRHSVRTTGFVVGFLWAV